MLPVTEFLRHLYAASGTILSGVSRIHLDEACTSFCSFVPQHRDELGPRSVVDIFGEPATRKPLHLERFDRDKVVISYQARARLVEVVGATPGGSGMTSPYANPCLLPSLGAASLAREGTLSNSQTPLGKARRPQAGNRSSVR